MQDIRIGFGQINPVVGDFDQNLRAITNQVAMAGSLDLVIFGELALCGYPLGDLSYRSDIIEKSEEYLQKLVTESRNYPNLTIVVGHVSKAQDKSPTQSSFAIAHNSASVISNGEVIGRYDKQILPNYDVFDDWRNFVPGNKELVFELKGQKVAVAICEDIWSEGSGQSQRLSSLGVDLLVVPNGSPYSRTKSTERRIAARKFQAGFALAYANLCGGQDELVFDGDSFLLDKSGKEMFRAPFAEGLITASDEISEILDDNPKLLFEALVIGLRDYCKKNGQTKIVLGLSGGIDSALSCAIAAEAIGASNVLGVALPSRYSSDHSISDAKQLASNIGSFDLKLSDEVLAGIDAIHKDQPNPAP